MPSHPLAVAAATRVYHTTNRLQAMYGKMHPPEPDVVRELEDLQEELVIATSEVVLYLRDAGYTWDEIASALGITRQAAHSRWS